MTNTAPTQTSVTTQVYRVFIKTTPQAVWDAITTPEWTQRYGYGLRDMYELRPGHAAMVAGDQQGPGAGGGWTWILSDLKSLLECGAPMSTSKGW